MRLKSDFIMHDTGDEIMLVPVGGSEFSGMVRGNKTFGAVLDLLKTETTEEQIVSAMRARFDAPEGAVERDVARMLANLRKIGALEE